MSIYTYFIHRYFYMYLIDNYSCFVTVVSVYNCFLYIHNFCLYHFFSLSYNIYSHIIPNLSMHHTIPTPCYIVSNTTLLRFRQYAQYSMYHTQCLSHFIQISSVLHFLHPHRVIYPFRVKTASRGLQRRYHAQITHTLPIPPNSYYLLEILEHIGNLISKLFY